MHWTLRFARSVRPTGLSILFGVSISGYALGQSSNEKFVIGALGDSITQAMNSGGILETPRNSWSTGYGPKSQILSHFHRLENVIEADVVGYNASKSGAVAADLDKQVSSLLRQDPDYVTLLIGANDVCTWPFEHQELLNAFTENVRQAVGRIVDDNQDVKILISPIPDMYRLWQVGVDTGCQGKWDTFRICSKLLDRTRTDQERLEFAERWRHANEALSNVANAFPDHAMYAESVETADFTKDHISSIDCFHPSLNGQNFLSSLTWQDGWFAGLHWESDLMVRAIP